MRKVKVGVIGCGMISENYLKNSTQIFDYMLDIVAVADLVPELAQKRAEAFNIPVACTVEELLANPDIEIVLNLTAPAAHASINLRVLHAGKHVYTEKPFALNREDADEVLALAQEKGLLVGCAPDTFLGAGIQTCIKAIDDGWIGTPYAANGTLIMSSPADWYHPNFHNFFKLGGDPLMDMGPYYLTALIAMFGPVRRVTGSARKLHEEVEVRNPKSSRFGEKVAVEMPTNVSAALDFHNGALANIQIARESFGYMPRLEVYGTEGNLIVPDPNSFGQASNEVVIESPKYGTRTIPYAFDFNEESRGLGLTDMAYAIRTGRSHRASGQLARHVLDVSLGIFESSEAEKHVHVQSTVERPAPMPLGLKYHQLDS